MAWLGLDIGGTRIKAVIALNGTQFAQACSPRYDRPDTDELIDALRSVVGQACRDAEPPEGVGLCVPGVRSEDGSSIVYATNVPGLEGISFVDLLAGAGLAGVPFMTTSDAIAASHDATGSLALSGRVAFVSIGAGVGLAVIDDGVAIDHTDGGAGHLGQMDVSVGDDPPVGPDGGRGSLEGYIGAAALRARFGDEDGAILAGLDSDPEPLIALARALRVVHVMYRPDEIVMLGGLGHRLAGTNLEQLVNSDLSSLAKPGAKIRFGVDDYHAARGAAGLASLCDDLIR